MCTSGKFLMSLFILFSPLSKCAQVLKHDSVEKVDHVDLDEEVIRTCEKYFPQWGDAWKDPRATLHIQDGAQFVRDSPDSFYDVIIQDSSDPFVIEDDGIVTPLPSGVLYEEDHICQLHRILKPNGILNIQVSRRHSLRKNALSGSDEN